MADSSSSSFQTSGSSSAGSFIPNYPQSPFLMNIAGTASNMADALYNWGQNVYGQIDQLTNANIGRYLDQAQSMGGLASAALQEFTGVINPELNQLVQEANTYASTPRIQQQMGMAEAESQQAQEAARQNALEDLRRSGVDPSAGRYASLNAMMRTQAGAAAAGAGTQAELATEATGRQLRQSAIQAGLQYPGFAVNAANTALQGIAGAQNAKLAAANTGANLMGLPNQYLGTAMGLKYPPLGTGPSSSASRGQSQQESTSPNRNQPMPGDPSGNRPGGLPVAPPGTGATPKTIPNPYFDPNSASAQGPNTADPNAGIPVSENMGPEFNEAFGYTPDSSNTGQDYSQFAPTADQYGAFGEAPTSYNEAGYSPSTDYSGGTDMYASQPDYGASDMSSYGGDYAYAQGGDTDPDATTGGGVDPSMSPSQGQETDDVNAQLNVGEFVIPKDVSRWKGDEFFHKLIAQSRKNISVAAGSVGGQPTARHPGPPSFVSQGLQ